MARISSFIIMLVVFSLLLAGAFVPLLDYFENNYGIDNYNASSLTDYNKLDELDADTQDIKEKTLNLQSRSGVLDVIGGFFEAGYDAIKVAFSSFGTFFGLIGNFFEDVTIYNANLLQVGLLTIVLLIIIFLIISTVVKARI